VIDERSRLFLADDVDGTADRFRVLEKRADRLGQL
jgi:hypothetical protein